MSDHAADVHVFKQHRTDGFGCWCNPRYQKACDECDGAEAFQACADANNFRNLHANQDGPEDPATWELAGCWKCDKGWVDVPANEAEASDVPLIVIHNP